MSMTTKMRVYELAKIVNLSNKELIAVIADKLNITVKSHSSTLESETVSKLFELLGAKPAKPSVTSEAPPPPAEVQPKAATSPSKEKPAEAEAAKAPTPTKTATTPQAPTPTSTPSNYTERKPSVYVNPSRPPAPASSQAHPHKKVSSAAPSSAASKSSTTQKKHHHKGKSMSTPPVELVDRPQGPVMFDTPLTVRDLALALDKRETDIIKHLFMKGIMVSINHTLDFDAMLNVATALGVEAMVEKKQDLSQVEVKNVLEMASSESESNRVGDSRSPVVSIMGHVDHGKTSLLDAIRQTRRKIVDGEAGGITQSIGAYSVERDNQRVVFLDTPGHEAFTAMRMRGAKATDIAILVVAADDGVMPQTIEAINHAKAAGIPMIVAVNKIDKPAADPDRVLTQLMEHNVMPEKWGGDVITVEVSALQRLGLDDLVDNILLLSELMNLRAETDVEAEGVIIEARLDKRQGPVATALIQKGTLRIGDNILIGSVGGSVRSLLSDTGERLKEAGPSTPVEITGLKDVPTAGAPFRVHSSNSEFRQLLTQAQENDREQRLAQRGKSAGGLTRSLDDENRKELRVVLKADTQGSLEAAQKSLEDLGTDEIQVNILHTATGDITEADVMLATASQAVVIGFNAHEDVKAAKVAENEGIRLFYFDIIYHMAETVEKLMLGELDAVVHETEAGKAEIRQLISVGKATIAGCMVIEGKVVRQSKAHIYRGKQLIYEGYVDMLKRFKDDAKEVAQGYECGISFYKFSDFQVGDIIVSITEEERARTSL